MAVTGSCVAGDTLLSLCQLVLLVARSSETPHPSARVRPYSGVHCVAATRLRSSSELVLGATPVLCASRPTAVAIALATARTSRRAGSREPAGSVRAGECSPSALAAA